MKISRMHLEFKRRANRLVTSHYRDLLPVHIDAKLHEAQLFFLEHFAEVHKLPFEMSQQRIDMLSSLVVGYPEQPEIAPDSTTGNTYEFKLSGLSDQYAHLVRAYAVCNDNAIEVSIKRHDELSRVLRDQFQRPSQKWGRLVGVFRKDSVVDGNSSLYVYSETGWTITGLRPEYIKYPREPFLGGYDSLEYLDCLDSTEGGCEDTYYNQSTDPVDSELPDLYHSLLVDIAVMLYYGTTDNPRLYQFAQGKVVSTS